MRTVFVSATALLLAIACASSHAGGPDEPTDAGPPPDGAALGIDASREDPGGADAPVAPNRRCDPHELWGCSHSRWSWFWDGTDCSPAFECWDMGFRSRRACVSAHAACGASDGCAPMDARAARACDDSTSRAFWNGTSCEPVLFCECEGEHCEEGLLFDSMSDCRLAYSSCGSARDCPAPGELCLENRVLFTDRESTIRIEGRCGPCEVFVDGSTIHLDTCTGAYDCADDGQSCTIPRLFDGGPYQLVLNGAATGRIQAVDSRVALEPGCFCGDCPGGAQLSDEQRCAP